AWACRSPRGSLRRTAAKYRLKARLGEAAPSPSPCRRSRRRSNEVKLLVIDDSDAVIEAATISFAVQWQETEVIGACDGESGLDLVEREHPDLVLLDITMPGIGGVGDLGGIPALSAVPGFLLCA